MLPGKLLDWARDYRIALWNGLLRHCNQACKMFANGHTSDPNPKEPILDFFGVSVKAEDVPQQVERMYLLKKKVGAYRHCVGCVFACLCLWVGFVSMGGKHLRASNDSRRRLRGCCTASKMLSFADETSTYCVPLFACLPVWVCACICELQDVLAAVHTLLFLC